MGIRPTKNSYTKLRLILGDQLNYEHSWFQLKEEDTLYVIMEMRQETDYVKHHVQKIIAFFASMYNFSHWLKKRGHHLLYLQINDPENQQDLLKNLELIADRYDVKVVEYLLPDEYRLDRQLSDWAGSTSYQVRAFDTEHFYTNREDLAALFKGKKQYLMERFYRDIRQKHRIMLDADGNPWGGKWNFDAENRKPFKSKSFVPPPVYFSRDHADILEEIEKAGVQYFGTPALDAFPWPVSRRQCLALLDYFIEHHLDQFGLYQDAMHKEYWNLFHSRLSFAMNSKMLSPKLVIDRVIRAHQANPDRYDLAQVEGFVRQIIGWREYMRGVYWAQMPGYSSLNYFDHDRALPAWFWTGETKMNCLRYSISQSLDRAYAHHIQRLMVIGNFALLAGIDPTALDAWYLGVYIDAIEWVEITNTRGMSQYADGGIVGTKPYVSSANYIHKMSNYCEGCAYDRNERVGPKACPFNSLYWRFYEVNRALLEKNPRIGMAYVTLNKMGVSDKEAMMAQAQSYLDSIEDL